MEAQVEQLKAEREYNDASELLRELDENERVLLETLKDMKEEERAKFHEEELPKHKGLLGRAREFVSSKNEDVTDEDTFGAYFEY